MSDFPVSRIMDFLRTVVPFDTLAKPALERLVRQMEIAYYPKGQTIIRRGDPPPGHIHIIQVGAARIELPDDTGETITVDIRGEGDVFGSVSILEGKEALFDIKAIEDMIAILLPADTFRDLVAREEAFNRAFRFSLARAIKGVRKGMDNQLPQLTGIQAVNQPFYLMGKQVADLMITDVITCPPSTSIRGAVGQMALNRVASIVIQDDMGTPTGIVTDTDLRERVLATGLSPENPVADIMTSPPHTIHPRAYAFDALLDMSHHGISHLPVVDNGRLVGIISDHDFLMETGDSPVGVVGDIEKARTLEELVSLRQKVDNVREMLLRQGGSVRKLVELVTELNDRVTLRLLALTMRDMEREGLGGPPTAYCWMSMGSEGRREQSLRTDQDNAIAFADPVPEEAETTKAWFLGFSERVVEGLVRYGFPRCPGGIMASNPRWCDMETYWEKTFLSWVNDPNPLTLRMASIFFDFRPLQKEAPFLEDLRMTLHQAIKGNPFFLRFMAKNVLYNVPPMGFFRQFVVEKSGEHKNKLNLKMKGLTPVVDAARVLALELGLTATNTFDRLKGALDQNLIDRSFHSDLEEAYGFISYLRISRHLEARAKGVEPDNFLDPASLNSLQRKMLKESFAVINRLQEMIEFRYQTQFVLET